MPTLFARRYARKTEEVGNTEKVLGSLILLIVAGIVVLFVVQVATNEEYLFLVDENAYLPTATQPGAAGILRAQSTGTAAENPFPDPPLEDWRAPVRVERFTADNLYTKIDGRAEAYLKLHVVGLTFGTYRHRADAARTIDVYWYDMGTPANALDMYRSEQAPGGASISVGSEGYQIGGAVFFCAGSAYVQVLPNRLDDADANAALKIAERLADRVEAE
jgi:hypothetical protein